MPLGVNAAKSTAVAPVNNAYRVNCLGLKLELNKTLSMYKVNPIILLIVLAAELCNLQGHFHLQFGGLVGLDDVASLKYHVIGYRPNYLEMSSIPNPAVPVLSNLFDFLRPKDQQLPLRLQLVHTISSGIGRQYT